MRLPSGLIDVNNRRARRNWSIVGAVAPAMGYADERLRELEATVNATECDFVVTGLRSISDD